MTIVLDGVFAPAVTCFGADGELDTAAFTRNLSAHIEAGLHGIVVGGSTGEAALLDERERAALVEAARGVVPTDRLLIVGTGAESTRSCIAYTRAAAERGADAVLVVAPHYYGSSMTAEALRDHYRAVADASPVPVVLYTIPKYMHFAIPPALVAELATHDNIVGIKDSSGNRDLLEGYLQASSDSFAVLTGNGGLLRHSLSRGARGGILAVALFTPSLALDAYAAGTRGDDDGMGERSQEIMAPLASRIVGELGVPGVKSAMDAVGLCGGPPRSPLRPVTPAQAAEIAALLRSAVPAIA